MEGGRLRNNNDSRIDPKKVKAKPNKNRKDGACARVFGWLAGASFLSRLSSTHPARGLPRRPTPSTHPSRGDPSGLNQADDDPDSIGFSPDRGFAVDCGGRFSWTGEERLAHNTWPATEHDDVITSSSCLLRRQRRPLPKHCQPARSSRSGAEAGKSAGPLHHPCRRFITRTSFDSEVQVDPRSESRSLGARRRAGSSRPIASIAKHGGGICSILHRAWRPPVID